MKKLVKIAFIALCAISLRAVGDSVIAISTALPLFEPYAIAVDYADNSYYISDGVHDRIVKYTPATPTVAARTTSFTSTFNPTGIAIGSRAGLGKGLILAGADHRIHFLNLATAEDTVLAGSTPGYADNTNGASAKFLSPQGIAIAADGTVYVADVQNNRIRRIANTAQAAVTTVAPSVNFRTPVALTLDDNGNLFVADNGNDSIKVIDTLNSDQYEGQSFVSGPRGLLWVGGDTGLLVASTPQNVILRVLGTGGLPSVYAGKLNVVGGTDASFTESLFNAPAGLTIDANGNILVADTANNALRKLVRDTTALPKVQPISGSYSNSINLIVSDDTPGTTLRYTTDKKEPNPLSAVLNSGQLIDGGPASGGPAIVQIRGFNPDFVASGAVSNNYVFFVDPPKLSPPGATNNDAVSLRFDTATVGAMFYYTTDGSDPTPTNGISEPNGVTFSLAKTGVLRARAYKAGYTETAIMTNNVLLIVSDPVISPNGATSGSPVAVTLTSATPGASIYWTIDGSTPTTNSTSQASGSSFVLATNGTLKVIALRDGFVPSQVVSRDFNLQVATPTISLAPAPNNGTNLNKVTVGLSDATTNAIVRYTLDGSSPITGISYTTPFTLDTNAIVRAIATFPGFASSVEATNAVNIKVDAPVMSPPGGVFQDGTTLTLTVLRSNSADFTTTSSIHYTLNGNDPTEVDPLYTGPIRLSSVNFPATDLRLLKARAFANNTLPSDVISGAFVTNNTIGIPRNVNAGMGSKILIPVTVLLKEGVELRSVQYRVQCWPVTPGAPNLNPVSLGSESFSTNDFVTIISQSGTITNSGRTLPQSGNPAGVLTNEMFSAFIGSGANLLVKNFGTIDILSLELPGDARTNDVYAIRILEVSGTSDAQQTQVPIFPGADRQVVVTNISYLVGDSSPGGWYNAGDFGDNNLENSDVNNAFYVALGLKVPYRFSDVFNAMDAFPVDTTTTRGGDGIIRFLDWQTILSRSLRSDGANWRRSWTPDGVLAPSSFTLGPSLLGSPLSATEETVPVAPGTVWFREARIDATQLEHIAPGASVSLPVYITTAAQRQVSGLMFRALVEATGGAPELTERASFSSAAGLPGPNTTVSPIPLNEIAVGWNVSSFNPPLTGHKLIGQIHFKVPAGATSGQCYRVRFAMVDGSPDLTHEYNFESHAACVFVQDTNHQPADPITDEWRVKFFGSTTSPDADPMADPDGDQVPNWKEYLAGTDPTNPDSKLELHRPHAMDDHNGVSLSWLTAPGKTYVVETASSVNATQWTVVATGVIGDGNFHEVIDSLPHGSGQFYRIRLEDQP